jgi:hypothetical protein
MSNAYRDRVSRRFGIAGCALGAWGMIYPRPYLLVMPLLVLSPLIGVLVARALRGDADPFDDDKSTSLATFVILPPWR